MKIATVKCPECKKDVEFVPKYAHYLMVYAGMQSEGEGIVFGCPHCEGALPTKEIRKIAKEAIGHENEPYEGAK